MNIILAGAKGAGKSAIGAVLGPLLGLDSMETDDRIETLHEERDGHFLSCREIFVEHSEAFFRDLERTVTEEVSDSDWKLIITGGSILLDGDNRRTLRKNSLLIMLVAEPGTLWERAIKAGIPPWLDVPDGKETFAQQVSFRNEVLKPFADIVFDTTNGSPETLAEELRMRIVEELQSRSMCANTYGELIRITTFGESHGPAIGVVLDGLRPGLPFDPEQIQTDLNRRRPGQSEVTTPRSEKDQLNVLSGVFEGKTTGAPLAMVIFNKDQDSSKYEGIRDLFRPGHADFTYYRKYGIRDHRGGGRSSGRETAGRVMGGAVARAMLAERGIRIVAHAVEIAGIAAQTCDYDVIEQNPVRCADPEAAKAMEEAILAAKDDSNSVGGIVQLDILGLPAGLGDPIFLKLDARLMYAVMTLGAVKGVEVGEGFALARLRGSESNDGMGDGGFLSNNAGGITGGISTGQPVKLRLAVKPTSSIASPQQTMDIHMKNQDIEVHGRHDPCIVPRVIPVVESTAALVLLDAWEIQSRLRPGWDQTGQ